MHTRLSSVVVALSLLSPALAAAATDAPARQASSTPARMMPSSAPQRASSAPAPSAVTASSQEPQEAGTDYLLELGGVEGESTKGNASSADGRDVTGAGEEGRTDAYLKIDGVEGEAGNTASSSASPKPKGNVEYEWKVEEGESAAVPGVEPDEIDVAVEAQPLTPDFSILLGGGGGSTDDREDLTESQRSAVTEILLQGLADQGAPAETLSLNYEKITTKATQDVRLFGFIPVVIRAEVSVNGKGDTEVSYPWWGFLASGKDAGALGDRMYEALWRVLQTKHDTIKNAIGNIR